MDSRIYQSKMVNKKTIQATPVSMQQTLIQMFSKNPNITKAAYYKTAGLLIILFILIFLVLAPLQDSTAVGDYVKAFDRMCLVNCDADACKAYTNASRGETYNLTGVYDSYDGCIFNIWEISHIFLHALIGYWLDIRYSLGIGFAFEIFEWGAYGCENYTDILWNTIGCAIGSYIRISNKTDKYNR